MIGDLAKKGAHMNILKTFTFVRLIRVVEAVNILARGVWKNSRVSALVRYSDPAEILGAQPARRYRGSSLP